MSQPNLEGGSRSSTRPNLTVAEAAEMLQHWRNIANDYEVFQAYYDTRNLGIGKAFVRARLLTQSEIYHWLGEANSLYMTVKAGTTPQRDQIGLHIKYGQLQGNRDIFRARFESLRVDLRKLGLKEPGEGDAAPEAGNRGRGMQPSRQPHLSQMGGLPHQMNFRQYPSGVPVPSAALGHRPQLSTPHRPTLSSRPVEQPYPSIQQRLNPRYRERSQSPPTHHPASPRHLSQPPPHPSPQISHPNADREIRRLRDENAQLRAENAGLRAEHEECPHERSHLIHWYKMQEEGILEKDEMIKKLREELQKEKERKDKE